MVSLAVSYLEQLLMYEGRGVLFCVWVFGNTIYTSVKVCVGITSVSWKVCLRKGCKTATVWHKYEVRLGVGWTSSQCCCIAPSASYSLSCVSYLLFESVDKIFCILEAKFGCAMARAPTNQTSWRSLTVGSIIHVKVMPPGLVFMNSVNHSSFTQVYAVIFPFKQFNSSSLLLKHYIQNSCIQKKIVT